MSSSSALRLLVSFFCCLLAASTLSMVGCTAPSTGTDAGTNQNNNQDAGNNQNNNHDAGNNQNNNDSGPSGPVDGGFQGMGGDPCTDNSDCSSAICIMSLQECQEVDCNPVTNAACDAGMACDVAGDSSGMNLIGFACYTGPNTVADCGSCDPSGMTPPFCSPGSTCFTTNQAGTTGACAHYCCTDADCGAGNGCADMGSMGALFAPISNTLGICVPNGADAGSADAGPFACNVTSTAPSNGSCITIAP
jgi:hypothetical protein